MEDEKTKPLTIVETRVSDQRQLDGTHAFQEAESRRHADLLGFEVLKVWNTTISGDSDERLDEILAYVDEYNSTHKRKISEYICYNIERFTRGGHAMYDTMKREFRRRNVTVHDVAGIIQPDKNTMENLGIEYDWSKYSPSETQELLEADRAKDNKRDMLTRMIGQEVINAREGYAVHPAPDGFVNSREHYFEDGKSKKRTTRKRDDKRAHFYETMFELRAAGQLSDEEIVEKINAMGFLSKVRKKRHKKTGEQIGTIGGKPFTVKQLQDTIQRPSYAAINYEKWTLWLPVRCKWQGLVSIETWNKANRGRWYIEEKPDGSLVMHQNYEQIERSKENPLYPYKDVILCSVCKKPFRGSASRSKSGKHVPAYHCERKVDGLKHKRVSGNKWKFEEEVENFVHALSFDKELCEAFKLVLRDKFYEKQKNATAAAADAGKRVVELQEQKTRATQAYISANATGDVGLMNDLKAERDRIDGEIQVAQSYRNTLEVTERDLDDFLYRFEWVMEHPAEFLLRAENKPQRQAYFSLMFEELPTYQDILDGTPQLEWVFGLVEPSPEMENASKEAKSSLVRREGFEPP